MAKLRKILALLITGFVVGVAWGSYVEWARPWLGLFLILTLAFLILFFLFKKQNFFLVFSIIFVGVILGLFRFNLEQKTSDQLPDCTMVEKKCVGLIVADPDRRDVSTRLVVDLAQDEAPREFLRNATSRSQVVFRKSSRVLAIVDNFTNYAYGDKVELVGKIEQPQNFLTPPVVGQAGPP